MIVGAPAGGAAGGEPRGTQKFHQCFFSARPNLSRKYFGSESLAKTSRKPCETLAKPLTWCQAQVSRTNAPLPYRTREQLEQGSNSNKGATRMSQVYKKSYLDRDSNKRETRTSERLEQGSNSSKGATRIRERLEQGRNSNKGATEIKQVV